MMNYQRIYEYRFQGINKAQKMIVWTEIAKFIYHKLQKPSSILDPAGGMCEFINAVPSAEKWAIDLNKIFLAEHAAPEVKQLIGNNLEIPLPENYFAGVFISNFLEHLHTQEEVALFLTRMHQTIKVGGHIAVIGPNFKYTSKEYFDFADHTVILSDLGVAEHLYGAGFEIVKIYPKFLPLSFRGKLPVHKWLVQLYLKLPIAWNILGKQFLVIAKKI
jgi:hypothetical protein